MSHLPPLVPETTTGKTRQLLDGVQAKLGRVPNLMRVMANAPAVLDGYLQLSGALSKGALPAQAREQIALAVGQANECGYCVAAHSTLGKMAGLTADQIRDSRLGTAVDPKADAVIRFARQIVDRRGLVTDCEVKAVREAGLGDGDIAEVVANVALNIFTNYFNHVAGTEIDFPEVEDLPVDHHDVCATLVGCDPTR